MHPTTNPTNHHGIKLMSVKPNMIRTTTNNKQPSNIFTSYLHLYYMKSKSKNQPNLKLNLKIILKIGLFLV